jgi:hypothetical protein
MADFLLFKKNMALNYSGGNLNDWTNLQNVGIGTARGTDSLNSWVKPAFAAENVDNFGNPSMTDEEIWNANRLGPNNEYGLTYQEYLKSLNTKPTGGSQVPAQQQQSSGTPAVDMSFYQGWNDPNAIRMDWEQTWRNKTGQGSSGGGQSLSDYMKSQIESGYNDYFSKLNDLYSGLNTQGQAQENIAQNSYNQSISDLLANKQSSLGDIGLSEQKLQANQVKNLRDIGSNIQNQYMAGNVMLGARGAGDSSAANQYSYALNRIGSKERGNVMNQTAQSQAELENQKAKLNNIVTQETSRLDTEFANTKQQISSWLAEQQNAIKQMIAEGTLRKSQDIASATTNALNTALSLYQTKASEINNKKSQLESWAMSNASKISELATNMRAIGQYVPNMPTANAVNGGVQVDSQGNLRSLFGYGTSDEDKPTY